MKQTNRKADLPLLLLAVVLIFLIVCPVGMIFAKAVMQNGRLDFSPAVQTLLNPENAHMIGNSLLLGVLVVLLSTLIAAPLAYLFSRTKFARYRVFDILFMIPFMTPPYIASMGWILFMQKKGLLQQLIPAAAGCEKIFFTLGGLVLVMSLHVFPFMLTMLKNAMLNIPSSLEEAGAVFGAGFSARMRKIFLPLLSGNYAIGALLVFVKTLSEYGTPSTLGKRIGFEVFTTEIHRHATVAPIDFGSSATLSSVLVGICLCMWMLQNYITTRKSYNLVSGKGARRVEQSMGKGATVAAWAYIVLVLLIAVGVPYFSVISTSLINLRGVVKWIQADRKNQSPRLRSGTGQLYHRTLCRTVHRERKGIECSEEQRFSCGHFGYHLCSAGHSAGIGGAEVALQTAQGGRSHWSAAGNAAGYCIGHWNYAILEPNLQHPAAVQHYGHHGSGLCGAVSSLYGAVRHFVLYPNQ